MSPKAPATPGKEEGTKRVKDLELLLACVKSAKTFEVDFDELKKLDNAPTDGALRKRIRRMNQNLGMKAASTPAEAKPAANGDAKKASMPAMKGANTKKQPRDSDKHAASTEESPVKKRKTEEDSDDVKDGEDD